MISGRQEQRITAACTVLRETKILLLNEAMAALDSMSGKPSKRTTTDVARRLDTIRSADVIYVLQKGRMVEAGKHREVIGKAGSLFWRRAVQHT